MRLLVEDIRFQVLKNLQKRFLISENFDKNGNFLKPIVLKEKYSKLLENKPENLIIHCGSGVTACHTILALYYAGFKRILNTNQKIKGCQKLTALFILMQN